MEPLGFTPSIQRFLVSFVYLNYSHFYFNCGSLGTLEKFRKIVVYSYGEIHLPVS